MLSILGLSPQDIQSVVHRAHQMRAERAGTALAGKTVILLFEKPSLRTRASFHVAVNQLGGYSFYMGPDEVGLGAREAVSDVARVSIQICGLYRCQGILSFQLGRAGRVLLGPVIMALSDWEHPCQTLADLQTMCEHKGSLEGLNIVYVGDGNNVARSLCLGAASVGANFAIASPPDTALTRVPWPRQGREHRPATPLWSPQ